MNYFKAKSGSARCSTMPRLGIMNFGMVKLGQKANLKVDTYPDKSFEGKVIYISPEAEFTPKYIQTQEERTKLVYAVKIKAYNPDFELKDGMPADASIIL